MELWYAIVDLLPFEWAESGSMYFMKNALLAVLVISPLFGILSTMVVHSRMSFFSDALGHSAFTGMAIGALCGFAEPTWAAVVFAVVFAVLFNVVRRRTAMASDTVIGVFSSTAVALGIFISTLGSRSFTKFNSLLIGDILSVEPSKIGVLALILLLVCALWGLSFNQLMLSAVHPDLHLHADSVSRVSQNQQPVLASSGQAEDSLCWNVHLCTARDPPEQSLAVDGRLQKAGSAAKVHPAERAFPLYVEDLRVGEQIFPGDLSGQHSPAPGRKAQHDPECSRHQTGQQQVSNDPDPAVGPLLHLSHEGPSHVIRKAQLLSP